MKKQAILSLLEGLVIDKGFKIDTPKVSMQISKVNNNGVEVKILKQNFKDKTGVLGEFEDFKIKKVYAPELRANAFYLAGEFGKTTDNTPVRFLGIDNVNEYIYKLIMAVFVASFEGKKVETDNVLLMVENELNFIVHGKYLFRLCKMCGCEIDLEGEHDLCCDCRAKFVVCRCGSSILKEKAIYIKEDVYCTKCIKTDIPNVGFSDYSWKPSNLKFFGQEGKHFGVEIEVEFKRNDEFNRSDVVNVMGKYGEHCYFKTDGSLDYGFEMITYPSTMEYHRENTAELIKILSKLNCKADGGTCGLHIHVGRDKFGTTDSEKEEGIGRILALSHKFFNELKKVCKRKRFNYCENIDVPSMRNRGQRDFNRDIVALVGASNFSNVMDRAYPTQENSYAEYFRYARGNSSRYKSVNVQYAPTVEFRLPQGTLDPSEFMAYLQLWDRMIDISVQRIDFENKSFNELFVGHHEDLDRLIATTL